MSIDGLLTLAALLVAVYAVIPRSFRMYLGLTIGRPNFVFFIFVMLIVNYLVLYPFLPSEYVIILWPDRHWVIAPPVIAYILVFLVFIYYILYAWFRRVPVSRIPQLQDLFDELIGEERYTWAFGLFLRNLGRLVKIRNETLLVLRIRSKLLIPGRSKMSKKEAEQLLAAIENGSNHADQQPGRPRINIRVLLEPIRTRTIRVILALLPNYSNQITTVRELFQRIYLNKSMVSKLATTKPYYGLKFLDVQVDERSKFSFEFISNLMNDSNSILYFEIENNQDISTREGYWLPKTNRFLYYLFADATIAEKLAVWAPVGEHLNKYLDKLWLNPEVDSNNYWMEDFNDYGRWESSLFVGIRFFDIMVLSALYQGIRWHMWLYYYRYITERIIRNYKPHPIHSSEFGEWPTHYAYYLYSMIGAMVGWIRSAEHCPAEQTNVILNRVNGDHQNDNIPKSAIIVLSQCIRLILDSEKISNEFKQYLIDIIFRLYFDLRASERMADYAKVLMIRLRFSAPFDREPDQQFIGRLRVYFDAFDKTHYDHGSINEFEREMFG